MRCATGFLSLSVLLLPLNFAFVSAGVQESSLTPSGQSVAGASHGEKTDSSFTVQLDEAQEHPYVIQSATRRVVVDVVVTGPDGKPASGLTERDFTVLENRKPQSIRSFEEHTPDLDRSTLPPGPVELPDRTFVNLEATPASGPPVAILLDALNTPVEAQMYARGQIERFLETKPKSLQVAIFTLTDSLLTVQGFTTDKDKLIAAMRSRAVRPHTATASEQLQRAETTLDAFLELGKLLAVVPGRKNLIWFSGSFDMLILPQAQDRQSGNLDVGREAGSPDSGNGPVITSANLVPGSGAGAALGPEASSSGFSSQIGSMTVLEERLKRVAVALAVSQTAVYPVDVRGLSVETGFSAGEAAASQLSADQRGRQATPGMPVTPGGSSLNGQSHNDFIQSLNATQATMDAIAEATGGRAFENSNGIAAAADAAVRDGSSYYTLVYAPSDLRFDGGLRAIHVDLDKPGYRLAYRSAYYAVDPSGVESEPGRDSLWAAMLHGAPETQRLIFKARIEPDGGPARAAADSPLAVKAHANVSRKAKNDPDFLSGIVQAYQIQLAIVAKQLQFTASDDGRHHAALQIAVYAYAADGRKVGGTLQKIQASLPPAVFAQASQEGMYHNLHVSVPVEAASLRLAVQDSMSHRIGSMEIPLPLTPAQQSSAETAPSVKPQ